MEINWTTIGIVLFFAILLVLFLVKRNLKDKKKLEKYLNNQTKIEEETELNDEEEQY
jgi:preprotein translocase subunit SecG